MYLKARSPYVFPEHLGLFPRDLGNHLKPFVLLTAENTCRRRGFHAPKPSCMGNDDALYILYDIAAGPDLYGFRQLPQNASRLRRAIGDGNRLRTSHGRHQLLLQYSYECLISLLW